MFYVGVQYGCIQHPIKMGYKIYAGYEVNFYGLALNLYSTIVPSHLLSRFVSSNAVRIISLLISGRLLKSTDFKFWQLERRLFPTLVTFLSPLKSTDFKFRQLERKFPPMLLTWERELKSTDVKPLQPARKLSPILLTWERGLKATDVKLPQPMRKLRPMLLTFASRLRSMSVKLLL